MKKFSACQTLVIALLCLLPLLSLAQNKTQDSLSVASKLDSIYKLQKKMYNELKNEPLKNKNYGIEFKKSKMNLCYNIKLKTNQLFTKQ